MSENKLLFKIPKPEPKIFVLSGLSGSGKDSVLKELKKHDLSLHFVVTATTRGRRQGEVNGVDYFFVSVSEFEEMISSDKLIEHAIVYEQYKGIPKAQITEAISSGKDVVIRVDVQGAARVKSLFPQAILIFLIPANEDEWKLRLINREGDTEEQLQVRSKTARQELDRLNEFNYIVVNPQDRLDLAVKDVIAIINAERLKVNKGNPINE